VTPVPLYAAGPFLLLLASIAIIPLVAPHWWERHYPKVAFALALIVVLYYLLVLRRPARLFLTAEEYVSFIVLIGSLFVVTGGILIRIEGTGTPLVNTAILAVGAVVANVLGTTGASALLIRPYLRINEDRLRPFHVVFFIFVVSNVGGLLTPIGDPPLFLGYLKGVPFFWIFERVWLIWLFAVAALLAIFYAAEMAAQRGRLSPVSASRRIEIVGWKSLLFLGAILGAVFLHTPWREVIMAASAWAAYRLAPKPVLAENEFSFGPIREVAIVFAGIFATMVPALDWLEANAGKLGVSTPGAFYWGTGILSSVLDNAPTYLNFLAAAFGLHGLTVDNPEHMRLFLSNHWKFIQAVSVGAVFFGACTYIGNGPNFLVKSIAEQGGVPMPSFFGYVLRFTVPVLLPIFAAVWFFTFR
jgi:Na+/H+ antiporter NhaD/arsenite permease-like protein